MKVLIADLGTCGVNYQNYYILEQLNGNFEFTQDINEADTIIMLGGCCCTEPMMYQTMDYIKEILNNKRSDATTYLTRCITRTFKNIPKLLEFEQFLENNIDYVVD